MISIPGFYEMTAAEYHADCCEKPSLSSSLAVDLVYASPAHARLKHPRLSPQPVPTEETAAMSFGSVVHELLLGKGGGFEVWDGDTWRGKDAAAFKEAAIAAGKTPIKRADFDRAKQLRDGVLIQLESWDLEYILSEGKSEQVAVWKEGEHFCRAMFDRWIPERNEIWDIKTTGKLAHPDQIARTVASMHYDLRSEFYLRGAEKLTGIPAKKGGLGFIFLFVETEPPFCVVPCYLDGTYKARGKMLAGDAVKRWIECMESGCWPGYVSGPVEITAPGWVDYEIEDSLEIQSSTGGKVV